MKTQDAPHKPWTLNEFIDEVTAKLKKEGVKVSVPSQHSNKRQTLIIPEGRLETIKKISNTLNRLDRNHQTELYKSSHFSIYGVVKSENDKVKIELHERRYQ